MFYLLTYLLTYIAIHTKQQSFHSFRTQSRPALLFAIRHDTQIEL